MNFILWTLVWWGLEEIAERRKLKGFECYSDYDRWYDQRYSDRVILVSAAVKLFLWIYLYVKFIA